MCYATAEDYAARYPGEQPENIAQLLQDAENDVNAMTYGRVSRMGYDNLSPFQRDKLRDATCEQAHFALEYGEMLDNPLASYSVGGVSMGFREEAVQYRGQVATNKRTLSLLLSTGLAYRGVG